MKIKKLGFTSFKISTINADLITDPLLAEKAGLSIPKTSADAVIFSEIENIGKDNILETSKYSKITTERKDKVYEISSPGEYEIGGVLIRREIDSDIYVLDEGHIRLVYIGQVDHKVDMDNFHDLGDVDVLIIPIGDSDIFPNYDKLEKIIAKIDPTYLIPSGYKETGLKGDFANLKTVDEFIKYFGYTHVRNDKKFDIASGIEPENKVIEIVVLE